MIALTAFLSIAMTNPSPSTIPMNLLKANDVVWTTPSKDAAGSMPIGNGEVVLNVWVDDATGDLLFYIARTDALSEIARFLKLGQIRVHLDGNPLKGAKDFRQRLSLREGRIDISANGVKLTLFVDSDAHVIYVKGQTREPLRVTATQECWRNASRVLPDEEQRSAWTVHDAPFKRVESPDVFLKPENNVVTWYHRNESTVVPAILENQTLVGAKGTFDPILHRTFGGSLLGEGFVAKDDRSIVSDRETSTFSIQIATHSAQTETLDAWVDGLKKVAKSSSVTKAESRTKKWWSEFWNRSWMFVEGDDIGSGIPTNDHPLRKGVDASGGNVFPGEIGLWEKLDSVASIPAQSLKANESRPSLKGTPAKGITLSAWIKPTEFKPGRIFDQITPGGTDGFLFDTHPGDGLRLIVGSLIVYAPQCLKLNEWQMASATYNEATGEAAIYLNGKCVAQHTPEKGSAVTRGYILQRYCQAIQGRGYWPIKFNGGYYTVEPKAMGRAGNADYREWGDCHWFQNVRHMYHPMVAQGDWEMMDPFFRLYESTRELAETRTKLYHGVEGAYFPETMTVFGTYSGGDYGWDRTGLQPKDVQCPWWQYAWNQGPELVALMLDRWDATRDEAFLQKRLLPMAESVLKYFDTRFSKDPNGKIVLNPTQVVESFIQEIVNDMPSTAGLIAVTNRLCALPSNLVPAEQRKFLEHMKAACPDLPIETNNGEKELAPAQKYKDQRSNCENGELYGVWPFQVVSLAHPKYLEEAKRAYAHRGNRLDTGWGYDGNVAALLGMTDEAARILKVKCANSHPAYRWPATWGPNFDWLPDQNHGGNLLNTANLMLLQSESLEEGGKIRLLPSWPKNWDVDFKLHAAGNTLVECKVVKGKIVKLKVTPETRKKDVILPKGWLIKES